MVATIAGTKRANNNNAYKATTLHEPILDTGTSYQSPCDITNNSSFPGGFCHEITDLMLTGRQSHGGINELIGVIDCENDGPMTWDIVAVKNESWTSAKTKNKQVTKRPEITHIGYTKGGRSLSQPENRKGNKKRCIRTDQSPQHSGKRY